MPQKMHVARKDPKENTIYVVPGSLVLCYSRNFGPKFAMSVTIPLSTVIPLLSTNGSGYGTMRRPLASKMKASAVVSSTGTG